MSHIIVAHVSVYRPSLLPTYGRRIVKDIPWRGIMSKDVVFTVKLEPDLRDEFLAEAEATHRPASQLVREFMREFIERQRTAREHDAWFRTQVEQGMREADD